jgi:quinolinate synthase
MNESLLVSTAPEVQPLTLRPRMESAQTEALTREIHVLKKQLNAVILAHNYQIPEIQDVADYVGDSLGLSQQAARTSADVIVFCGVHFMAETAKILNPGKIVVLPDKDAGCSLEQSCPAEQLAEFKQTNPNFWTIAYINCSAGVKALTDVICTSGNAMKIVEAAPKDKDLLFVPDENLGEWVMEQTGRPMTLWKGNCYVHAEFRRDALLKMKQQYPEARGPRNRRCGLLDRKDDHLLQSATGEAVYRGDRIRHHPPPPKGMPGQGVPLRARVRCQPGADGWMPVQRVQIHEDEHARKSA